MKLRIQPERKDTLSQQQERMKLIVLPSLRGRKRNLVITLYNYVWVSGRI